MATKKAKVPTDEKFTNYDIDIFDVTAAIDRKDYGYYSRLTPEQQRKMALFIMVHWASAIKSNGELAAYYLRAVNDYANTHLFNEKIMKHPELIWLMLCASSPGVGKQFHQWIPHVSGKVVNLQENANITDMKKYYTKMYPKANTQAVDGVAKEYVRVQKRKCILGQVYPAMKIADIEALQSMVSDEEMAQYERDRGN